MASVQEARAADKGVRSAFYPAISFDPSVVTREHTSANMNSNPNFLQRHHQHQLPAAV